MQMKVYEYSKLGLENLALVERPAPRPSANEVMVKFHAASLNYRDLLFAWGMYNPRPRFPAVPGSDGAGEVTAIGEGVKRWKVGDRVCPIFMQGWLEGPITPAAQRTALGGGDLDGTLREYGVFNENSLVAIPSHLSYEEAAAYPCAAVTAWHALVNVGRIKAGDSILTLGTGGVSVFAIQFAKLHGARVIATSSSEEKLARVRELGADVTINYKTHPEWDAEVHRLTGGVGVDHVVEVGGTGTMPRSVNATRTGGLVTVIGVLSQGPGLDALKVLMKSLHVQGLFVGSRQTYEDLNKAITIAQSKPVIDRVFSFQKLHEALEHMRSGAHFGKIIIQIAG